MSVDGGAIGVFAVVMGLIAGTMIVRRDTLWPFAFVLVGLSVALAIMVGMRR